MSGLVIGRSGVGLLMASALSLTAAVALAPRVNAGMLLPGSMVAVATIVLVSDSSVAVRAVAVAVAVGALAVRWLTVAPGRPTLAAARVAGLGAAGLVAAAPFLGPTVPSTESGSAVVAALLAVGILALVAVLPLGGWAVGCVETLQGIELAPWALAVAPAVLLTAGAVIPALAPPVEADVRRLLLTAGLAGATWSGIHAQRADRRVRYGRVLLADLGLCAAVVGVAAPSGGFAVMTLVILHLTAGPLLLNPARVGVVVARRVAWVAVSGLPLTLGFWGRLLVVQACSTSGGLAVGASLVGMALATTAALPVVVRSERADRSGGGVARTAGALAAAAAVALGVAPQAVAGLVFGGG